MTMSGGQAGPEKATTWLGQAAGRHAEVMRRAISILRHRRPRSVRKGSIGRISFRPAPWPATRHRRRGFGNVGLGLLGGVLPELIEDLVPPAPVDVAALQTADGGRRRLSETSRPRVRSRIRTRRSSKLRDHPEIVTRARRASRSSRRLRPRGSRTLRRDDSRGGRLHCRCSGGSTIQVRDSGCLRWP
jgi:hypothetical protein